MTTHNKIEKKNIHDRGSYPPFVLAQMLMTDPTRFAEMYGTTLCGTNYPGGPIIPEDNFESEFWWIGGPVDKTVAEDDWVDKNINPVTKKQYTMSPPDPNYGFPPLNRVRLPLVNAITPVQGQGSLWNFGYNRAAAAVGYIMSEDGDGMPVIKVLCVKWDEDVSLPEGFVQNQDAYQTLQNFPGLGDFVFAAARNFCEECFSKQIIENNPHIYRCVLEAMARGVTLGIDIPMVCDDRTTQNAGVCTSAVGFEIPSILLSYISKTRSGPSGCITQWIDAVTPYFPGDLNEVVPMEANHNYFVGKLAAVLEPKLKLTFGRDVWEYIRTMHKKLWDHAATKKIC